MQWTSKGGRGRSCDIFCSMVHYFYLSIVKCIIPRELLDMNRAPPNKAQRSDASLAEELRAYELWRQQREERIG